MSATVATLLTVFTVLQPHCQEPRAVKEERVERLHVVKLK